MKRVKKAPPDAKQKIQEQDEVARLKRRVSELEEENDILKNVWSAPVMQGPARMTVTGLRQCIRPLDGLSGDGPGHDGNPRIPLLNSFKTSLGPLF
ncbi:hypothetical protein [Billgrantia desiderata]|uniref:hypothetical protein n=1 Tax=Billgrantia desiderata TaxID=52021 RepID=UPI001748D7EF|nr:hypothetical protein [Halomonas desiderata]MCE8011591.1 hypothetical protein [Halomonas desiderata]NIC37673.1 hypothetical protein [Halomonas desiderata]